MKITLNFGEFTLDAVLFDTPVAKQFFHSLPQEVRLTKWGKEFYGSVSGNHGHFHPVSSIPSGGLAYTDRGSYFCIFFGQSPAWPVEHIGELLGSYFEQLSSYTPGNVVIERK